MLGFRDNLKTMYLQQLKGKQSFRFVKGAPFFNRRYTKGVPFLSKIAYKRIYRGLNLGAETSRIKLCRVASTKAFYDDKSSSPRNR